MEDSVMALITAEHLKYRYPGTDRLALDDVSFTIEKGEFIGIIGENGAGKSTLSQTFLGLIPQFYKGAYGGSVLVDGLNTEKTETAELCRKVGLIFQNPFNQLSGAKDTVYDEIGFGLQNIGIPADEIRRRIEDVLHEMDIYEYRDRNPFDLSGGQLQRVAIASVLAMQPEILVLDEPTSQLDPEGAEEVFRIVDRLTETGITIIMIEQKMEKLASYCDRMLLMHAGHLIAADTPRAVFSRSDLLQYGIVPPVFTAFAEKNGISYPDGSYPVTREELLRLLQGEASDEKRVLLRTALRKAIRRTEKQGSTDASGRGTAGNETAAAPAEAGKPAGAGVPEEISFRVEDLHFSYVPGTEIFRGLTLTLDRRPTAIIGQNGAGKTTLVRILKGLLKPDSGQLLYKGAELSKKTVAELAGKVGYVFQNPDDQIFKYNILDEVMFGPLNIGMDRAAAERKAREALETVGLPDVSGENPYDLELSERKMVAIASVLAMDTDVFILDEPTIAQDAAGRRKIGEIIRSLTEKGRLVIAILHDMDFVAENFERVIVMSHGRILADGTAETVFREKEVLEEAKLQPPHLFQLLDALAE